MQYPTTRYRDNEASGFGRVTSARFIDLETGEILERRQMIRFGRDTANLYAGRRPYCSNCTVRRRHRSKAWTLWAANFAANFALIAVLGLILVVIVVMGK